MWMLAGLSFRRRLRYLYPMSGIVEKTVAEAGFAASWMQHVAPVAKAFEARMRRQLLFASLVTGLAVGLAVVTVILSRSVGADNIMANPLYVSLVLALAALAAIAGWVSLLRRDTSLADAVDLAVETHFASLFMADGNEAFAEVILQDLVDDGILEDATHRVLAHHAGTYRGCRIRLFTASSQLGDGKFLSREGTRRRHLVVARMSLPFEMDGSVRIDSQRDRLPESAHGFHIDHDQFDHIFGVACSSRMAAAELLTPDFAETLLLIQQRLANPLGSRTSEPVRVSVQIDKGSLVLVIEEPIQSHQLDRLDPRRAEMLARGLIMRFATVPGLVDELYGDADEAPAFAALTPAEPAAPHIAL